MLKFYNHLTRDLELLAPNDKIRIYGCGPTVYDYAHLGNIATFIFYDQIRRALNWLYPETKIDFVINITDIDDKINNICKEIFEGLNNPNHSLSPKILKLTKIVKKDSVTPSLEDIRKIITRFYSQALFQDLISVGVDLNQFKFVYASDYLKEMQEMIQDLSNKGLVYELNDGLYFDIIKYQQLGYSYGLLEKGILARAGLSRLESKHTKNPADFAVWKKTTSKDLSWQINISINGNQQTLVGKPGWHLECSVMSSKNLETPFDIHLGGIDLRFPHHENELAQCLGEQANAYIYREHIMIDSLKMSKSLNNFTTLEDFRQNQNQSELVIRQWLNNAHYRSRVNWDDNALHAAQENLMLLKKSYTQILYLELLNSETEYSLYLNQNENYSKSLLLDISKNLSDDLNFPKLMSSILTKLKHQNISGMSLADFESILKLLGLESLINQKSEFIKRFNKNIWLILQKRQQAKREKNYELSDKLRAELSDLKILLIDDDLGQLCYDDNI